MDIHNKDYRGHQPVIDKSLKREGGVSLAVLYMRREAEAVRETKKARKRGL